MLNAIIHFSVRNKLIVGLMVLALMIVGVIETTKLPIDAVPDITNNQVLVITTAPSLGAPDVERFITVPIEQATRNVPGIVEQRSFSRFGLSLVTIVFNEQTDVYWARTQISERLAQVRQQIPEGMGVPELGPVSTGLGEIFQYVVRPKPGYEQKFSQTELRTIQDWIIRKQLLATEGIADVSSFGGQLKQYEVSVRTDKLRSLGVSISDVYDALQNNNQNTGGAYIEKGPTVLFIRTDGLAKSIEDIQQIVIKRSNGIPVLVRDVAEVKFGAATRYGALAYNTDGEVAGAVVMMLKGENSNKVIRNIKEKIKQIEASLPEGVMIDPFLDRTKMVNNAIGTVETNLLEGALIVVFVLVLFLGNFRAGFIVATVIPLSMLFAIIMMNAFGVSGNLMSLGALDFGLLVDGAVIIVEAVMHKMSKLNGVTMGTKLSREQMDRSVEESSGKMMNAAVFGQIIILIVYLPILSLQGIEGKMFKPMAQTVSFAILGAFILSLTYVPMMSAFFLSRKQGHKENISDKMMQRLQQWYKPLLHKSMKAPGIIIGSSVVLFAAAVVVLSSLGGEFIPKLEEGDFAVETRVLTGSSLTTTLQESQKAVKILLKEFPEVEKIVTKVGTGEIPSDPMPIESADMIIVLKDKKEWTSAKTFDELAEKMGERVSSVPGVTTGFQYPVQMRFNELMTGARQDVVCKIFGDDLDSLARYAAAVGEVIGTVEGAKDLFVETVTGIPQLVISYNREAIARYGATIAEVNRSVQAAYAGSVAGQIFENDRRFDLVIRLNESQRNNVDEIGDLLVELPSGQQVPLNVLAHVAIQEGPYQIQREDAQRRITIGFNVRGRDVQSIVEELQNKVKKQVQLPAGYYATYGGQFENLQQATKRLAIAVPAALLLIFVMLFFAFRKFKYCLLIFSAIPLSAIGGVFALWIRDMPFSISAGIGFIALFGVAVLNGIVLITEMNRLKAENNSSSIPEVIAQATETRLRPVLMTAAVASLGFLPMALSNGAGAEVQRPLATVVIGGLLSATLLTLFVLPSLYLLFEKKKIQIPMKPLLVIVMMLSTWSLQAQQPQTMKLEKLLELVKEKSPILKVGQLQEKYYTALKGTARDIPKTQLVTELGNYNSFNFDSRVSILQPFSAGIVYRKQELVLNSYLNAAEANTVIQQQVLEKIVRQLYLELQYLMARKKVLERADSVYGSFQRVAQLRFEKGESNLLEKTTLDNQVMQNRQMMQMNVSDRKAIQLELALLLQDAITIVPADELVTVQQLYDTALLQQHPELQYYKAQEQQAAAETQLAKAKLRPEWLIGYNNQSLMGWMEYKNRSERFFTAGDRFSSVTLGMSIPFFNKAQKAKVEAANVQEQVNRANTDIAALRLKTQLQQALQHRDKFNSSLTYFKNSALPQSNIIIQTANLNYKNGQISYIEWATLVNQALGIQMQYADVQRDHQLNEIQLDYLLQKN
ncbi:MAG: CusA/CzcA family heavy metal efflux RND transporter [Sediminibacterium sp. Gen4]|jgi:heavy metal efflux system protein|uniref:CusA/CzcA family heavy metal efflux RND transporter n=1 Tax=unclassified Sediminibacterium TaxID=2635961 RepID=UPI0015B961E6|nr:MULTISPECIES: CusA/CzcA family heavy metal efflux RND transporter [unclassified Sediminibacterium]MBW0161948.1 CusA/CzcA family heavy metal efflux RND transporter [Sediminibacterium sp.]MBW0165285.1 CusA/CzcA family heavy metal efflux RND transporter [Sediminibacterium sp.]NWK65075.1 CusA/CzcA family heavy metal efflux RND transporter [Sediminibacterium sp. Gen4]